MHYLKQIFAGKSHFLDDSITMTFIGIISPYNIYIMHVTRKLRVFFVG